MQSSSIIHIILLLLPQPFLISSFSASSVSVVNGGFRRSENHNNEMGTQVLSSSSSSSLLLASSVSTTESSAHAHTAEHTELEQKVNALKEVLTQEYTSFFDPMVKEYYADDVVFDDPQTTASGVEGYQTNVDFLAGRTLFGSILFQDANIVLHSVTGGDIIAEDHIANLITRWTLRFTFKALPWKPTAIFTGISNYTVTTGGAKGLLIQKQMDYWDSTDIVPNAGGTYQRVDKSIARKDFIDQIQPQNFLAPEAGREIPYELLRRGNDYEVRRFPTHLRCTIPYERRDEAYNTLGSFARGMDPLAPTIIDVDREGAKFMAWPLVYSLSAKASREELIQMLPPMVQEKINDPSWAGCVVTKVASQTVAVKTFTEACAEPVIRKEMMAIKNILLRDDLMPSNVPLDNGALKFAQFNAIYTMGKRRSEVWIPLTDGEHLW